MYSAEEIGLSCQGRCIIETPKTGIKQSAVLFIHGFASDKDEVGSVFLKIRQRLLKENIMCVSIELPGFNKGMRHLCEIDFQSLLVAVKQTYAHIETIDGVDKDNVSLCCYSMGCVIAALTFSYLAVEPKKMLFISPVLNLKKDFADVLGSEVVHKAISAQDNTTIKVKFFNKGSEVSKHMRVSFFKQLELFDPMLSMGQFRGELYGIAGENDFSKENLMSYLSGAGLASRKDSVVVSDADHIFNAYSPNSKIPLVAKWAAKKLMS